MLTAEKTAQAATLAAIRKSFNESIAAPVNATGINLAERIRVLASPELPPVVTAFNTVVRALNAAGKVLLTAIADTDAIVPIDPAPIPPDPAPIPPAAFIGAKNGRTGKLYEGQGGPAAAIAGASAGDTILIAPAVYKPFAIGISKSLTLTALVPGQRYVLDAGGNVQNRVIQLGLGVSLTLEDAEICNNKALYSNAGGIWPTGGAYTLTVRRCVFHDLNNGIIIGQHPEATVLIEDSEAYDNGVFDGQTHNFYIGTVGLLTFRRNFVHAVKYRGQPGVPASDISWGHLLKSRARVSVIEDNRFFMGRGEANRCIDLPNGGDATIRRNMMEYRTTQNKGEGQVVSYGVEEDSFAARHPVHRLIIEDNTVVNRASPLATFLWIKLISPTQYVVKNNLFAGPNMPAVKGDQQWAVPVADNRIVPLTAFVNADAYDWRLLPEPWPVPLLATGRSIGNIDGVTAAGVVQGWTLDKNDKAAINTVVLHMDGPAGIGTKIASFLTDALRPDVNTAHSTVGNHGFAYAIPDSWRDGKAHYVYGYGLDRAGGLAALVGSPAAFPPPPVLTPPTPPTPPTPAPEPPPPTPVPEPPPPTPVPEPPPPTPVPTPTPPVPPTPAPWAPQRDAAGDITNFADLPERTWMPVPGTAMEATIKPLLDAGGFTLYQTGDSKLAAVMNNYSGMAFDQEHGKMYAFGGGHHGGSDNGVYEVDLNKMKWGIASWPSHPTKDFTPEQFAYYTLGARYGGIGTVKVRVFPLKESSTGFAIKGDAGFSSTGWYAVTGPERDATAATPVFPDGGAWSTAKDRGREYALGGNHFALFDGRPISMHTYGGFVFSPSVGHPVLVTRAYWACKLDGSGWVKSPEKGGGLLPMMPSGERLWVQTDEKTGKIWWGGCGSSCFRNGYYFYVQGHVFDPVTWTETTSPILVVTPYGDVNGVRKMLVNAGDQMAFSFKAGRKIGGLCATGYGWSFDLDTGAKQLLVMTGKPYSGAIGDGRASCYVPHIGKLLIFDTSIPTCPAWAVAVDDPKAGGQNGALTVDCQPFALANAGALPWSDNGLVYSRLTYWEKHKLLVYFPTTKSDVQVCRIP